MSKLPTKNHPSLPIIPTALTTAMALATALVLALSGILSTGTAFAQSSSASSSMSTPVVTPGASSAAPSIGTPVDYINASGGSIATLTLTTLVRPWTEFGDYYTPDPGTEYVAVVVKITHHGTRGDLIVKPDEFHLQDVDGFLLSRSWATGADNATLMPASDPVAIAPGQTGEIVVVYQVLKGVALSQLLWQPEYDRLITVADLRP